MPDVPDFEAPYSASKRQRLKALADRLQRDWKGIAFPQGEAPWFNGAEKLPAYQPDRTDYHPANAWWLLELCRFAYTPDHKEGVRPWTRFDRGPYLEATPFRQIHSIHKTGSHAAIYRYEGESGPATGPCFRGTGKFHQWLLNLSTLPVPWQKSTAESKPDKSETAYVHQGFKLLFDRIWPLLEPLLRDQPRPLVITGHSLGGALAQMTAVECSPTALYTFGSPRTGNAAFGARLGNVPHYRVVHHHDIVTLLPHAVETLAPYDFRHHGELVHLNADVDNWQPDSPLTFLAQSFKSAHPPECFVDHTPTAYAQALLEAAGLFPAD